MKHRRMGFGLPAICWIISLAAAGISRAENIDPGDAGRQYAWSENTGWLNAEPNGNSGPGIEVEDFRLTGWMWGENIGWVSLSCTNTGSCASNDHEVKNDSFGVLSGFAWSENAGWINFGPFTGGVTINPASGDFAGYAWGENIGWISFSCVNTGSCGSAEYRVRTGWSCSATPPQDAPALTLAKSPTGATLTWTAVPSAGRYDIVRGMLGPLRSSGGNFTVATDTCLANDQAQPTTSDNAIPSSGAGYWYLVRGVNCGGGGTYNTPATSQVGDRDGEIASSGAACP